MSGRDLLYKPQITYIPEEESKSVEAKKVDKPAAKAPVKGPRDLGQVGGSVLKQMARSQAAGKAKAHSHTYFNKDTSGVRGQNLAQSNMQALRGSEEATNLRKVVLPPAIGVEHPEPAVLQGAMDLMGVADGFSSDLASLLGRQGAWAKSKGMTVEMLEERMAQLEAMVEARKAALGRMGKGRSDRAVTSVTLLHAARSAGAALDDVEDVAAAGDELIRETASQADGLHARLAKMFGVKMQ